MTLKDCRFLAELIGEALGVGAENDATSFFDEKIAQQGADEPVIAAESQVMLLIQAIIQKQQRATL